MGVDLTICPERFPHPALSWLASVRLPLDCRLDDVWDALRNEATPCEKAVHWYGDDGMEMITADAYGNPLSFVTAHQFLRLMPEGDYTPWDQAVLAFVDRLPVSTRILLYFH